MELGIIPKLELVEMAIDPGHEARRIVESVMLTGSKKDGRDSTWRKKGKIFHLMKAVTHAGTALAIELGVKKPDGENHAELALTRLAMALSC
jgi:hypothetical protein